MKAGKKALSSTCEGHEGKQVQAQIRELERIIGRLTIENQILKKTEELTATAILGEQLTVQQSNIVYNDCLYCLKDIPIDKAIDRQHAKTLGNM